MDRDINSWDGQHAGQVTHSAQVREFVQQPNPILDRTGSDALGRIRTLEQGLCILMRTDSDPPGPFFFA